MTFFPDLAEASMVDAGSHIRAIGWLDDEHSFPTGNSPTNFADKLRELTQKCGESIKALGWDIFMGCHTCQLCGKFKADLNLGVPTDELLYVAPEMILHYVEQHSYLPPQEFIDAVLQSPIPGTPEYTNAVAHFRELHAEFMDRQFDAMYERAARDALDNGGDDDAIKDAANRFCGGWDDETFDRIASLVAELAAQTHNAR